MTGDISSDDQMISLGESIGRLLNGGEVIELLGDVGAGKTTLVKGIAVGLGVDDTVQSPSFTICRVYDARDGLILAHYDFYRLDKAGIMIDELGERLGDSGVVTVIEWGGIVEGVLPDDRLTINIKTVDENVRQVEFRAGGEASVKLLMGIQS